MRRICKLLPKVTKNSYPQKNHCTSCNYWLRLHNCKKPLSMQDRGSFCVRKEKRREIYFSVDILTTAQKNCKRRKRYDDHDTKERNNLHERKERKPGQHGV